MLLLGCSSQVYVSLTPRAWSLGISCAHCCSISRSHVSPVLCLQHHPQNHEVTHGYLTWVSPTGAMGTFLPSTSNYLSCTDQTRFTPEKDGREQEGIGRKREQERESKGGFLPSPFMLSVFLLPLRKKKTAV